MNDLNNSVHLCFESPYLFCQSYWLPEGLVWRVQAPVHYVPRSCPRPCWWPDTAPGAAPYAWFVYPLVTSWCHSGHSVPGSVARCRLASVEHWGRSGLGSGRHWRCPLFLLSSLPIPQSAVTAQCSLHIRTYQHTISLTLGTQAIIRPSVLVTGTLSLLPSSKGSMDGWFHFQCWNGLCTGCRYNKNKTKSWLKIYLFW